MSLGRWIGFAVASSSRRHVSTWSGSNSESPIGWPWAARNVKHIAPPMTSASTMSSSASMTPSLSETLAPPSTATNGRFGSFAQAEQDLDLPLQQPAHRRRQRAAAGRRSRRGRGATRRRRR